MKALLYKQIRLVAHPMTFVFAFFGVMFLIPGYFYSVIFFYSTLGLFFMFLNAREQRDNDFSSLLPIKKADIVSSGIVFCIIIELLTVLFSIPFALLSNMINKNGNVGGIDANLSIYGVAFILYGFFNLIFFTSYYKNGYKVGTAFLKANIPIFFIVALDFMLPTVLGVKWLDGEYNFYQLVLLTAGFVFFVFATFLSLIKSKKLFLRVDL
ncbi:MAG: ABC-2 transporter permease [Clostridia bacterium]|nr:ABC-2 transporter permease [Clostridia bacterium]